MLANAADSARPGLGRRLATALYKRPRLQLGLLLAPPVGALVIAYLGALLLLLINAFWRYDAFTGSVVARPTLDNFAQILSTTVFRDVAVRTILMERREAARRAAAHPPSARLGGRQGIG